MKLYVYEHCPYCIKARMIFGFKKVNFELMYLLNDEEQFLLDLIGAKVVPVLERDDGTAMNESLAIIDYIDQLEKSPVVLGQQNPLLEGWLSSLQDNWSKLSKSHYVLVKFPEFETQAAVEYFTSKKEKDLGETLVEVRKHRKVYVARVNECLKNLDSFIEKSNAVNGILSLDDFHLFATLRNMTLFKDIQFPSKVSEYVQNISNLSQVPLLYDYSL